jgi:5-formyltetrahydrofolate cyclo-ligase
MSKRSQLRTHLKTRRNALSVSEQDVASRKIAHKLSEHYRVIKAKHIAVYLTNDGELSTSPFINWCWQQQKKIYLPVVHPFSHGNLLFLEYLQSTSLVKNAFGILEPALNVNKVRPIAELDIICSPLVAFDETGARLGMGGGFYDRTLIHWQKTNTYPLGIAHDCQKVESVPVESWDIPLPEIITPNNHYNFLNNTTL